MSADSAAPTGPLRVLVADDNRDAADSLTMLLGLWGHAAVPAYTGTAALADFTQNRADVVIADLAMPGIDGLELARQIRNLGTAPVLVALSGYADAPSRQAAADAGYDRFMAKPASLAELQQLLGEVTLLRRVRGVAEQTRQLSDVGAELRASVTELAATSRELRDESRELLREFGRPT